MSASTSSATLTIVRPTYGLVLEELKPWLNRDAIATDAFVRFPLPYGITMRRDSKGYPDSFEEQSFDFHFLAEPLYPGQRLFRFFLQNSLVSSHRSFCALTLRLLQNIRNKTWSFFAGAPDHRCAAPTGACTLCLLGPKKSEVFEYSKPPPLLRVGDWNHVSISFVSFSNRNSELCFDYEICVRLNDAVVCSTNGRLFDHESPRFQYAPSAVHDPDRAAFIIATDDDNCRNTRPWEPRQPRSKRISVVIASVSSLRVTRGTITGLLGPARESFHWPCDDMEGDRAEAKGPADKEASAALLSENVHWWSERGGYPLRPRRFRYRLGSDGVKKVVDEWDCDGAVNKLDLSAWLAPTTTATDRESTFFHDVEFTAARSGESSPPLCAHRVVLGTRVPYFRLMLSSGYRESQGQLARVRVDATREDMALVLRFIYGWNLLPPPQTSPERLLAILELAELFGLRFLSADCVVRLTALSLGTLPFAFRVLLNPVFATEAGGVLRKYYIVWLAVRWERVQSDARFAELPPSLRSDIEAAAASLVGHRRGVSLKSVCVEDDVDADDAAKMVATYTPPPASPLPQVVKPQ